jgi:hypothetical protein
MIKYGSTKEINRYFNKIKNHDFNCYKKITDLIKQKIFQFYLITINRFVKETFITLYIFIIMFYLKGNKNGSNM